MDYVLQTLGLGWSFKMKTIICDIDGTIFKYSPNGHDAIANEEPELLPNVKERFKKWENAGHRIVLITGRRESVRDITEATLVNSGIPFDVLLMGHADTGRILINDVSNAGQCKAHAISLPRDAGFYGWLEFDEAGL